MEQRRVSSSKGKRVQGVRQTYKEQDKAKLPKQIKIGYLTVKVDCTPSTVLKSATQHNEIVYGRYDERNATIIIDASCHPDIVGETFMHEVLHAIIRQTSLTWSEEEEEAAVRAISPILYGVIKSKALG